VVVVDENDIKDGKIQSQSLANLDATLKGTISELVGLKDFEGKWLQSTVSLCSEKSIAKRLLLIGAGLKNNYLPARARQIGLTLTEQVSKLKAYKVAIACVSPLFQSDENMAQLALGARVGAYSYPAFSPSEKSKAEKEIPLEFVLVHSSTALVEQLKTTDTLARAIETCRLLQDGPPNIVTPKYVAECMTEKAKALGLSVTVMGAQKLREIGFNAMMAVGGGSAQEPQFVVIEYKPQSFKKTVAFVGKGLTMDTGGYSIKTPATYQEGMKYDMSGAAVTLSSVLAIAELGLPVRVFGIAALCENMIDAHAYRVGDVIKGYSGKSIEIYNTDAEGRVVLSDALSYTARELKPDCIVEYSTLTGAMIISLGRVGAGLFAFDESLGKTILEASESTGERMWPMPTWEEIGEDVKGTMTDLKNLGAPGQAGSIAAAMFLKEFVDNVPFAHIDIAGVADGNMCIGYPRKVSAGYGIQLTVDIARKFS
jgi:leucyl aminopeptidase